jgi:hypothetical protein
MEASERRLRERNLWFVYGEYRFSLPGTTHVELYNIGVGWSTMAQYEVGRPTCIRCGGAIILRDLAYKTETEGNKEETLKALESAGRLEVTCGRCLFSPRSR